MTGAQVLAAAGIEVNKFRILARRSGEAILRYVAEAPLRSLRADLGVGSSPGDGAKGLPFIQSGSASTSALVRARGRKLEASLQRLEETVQAQAQDAVAMATGFPRTDNRIYVQNAVTAAIHKAKGSDDGHTVCGWRYAGARKKVPGLPYRVVTSLVDMPGTMLCERCLPTERAIAVGRYNAYNADLSGDEQ